MKAISAYLAFVLALSGCSKSANPPTTNQSAVETTSPPATLSLPGDSRYPHAVRPPPIAQRGSVTRVLVTSDCNLPVHMKFESHYEEWDSSAAQPFSLKDPRTQVTFYVESDGRHLAAVDAMGNLLWVRNPFEDAKLCHYRTPRPIIYSIEAIDLPPNDADTYVDLARPELKRLGMDFTNHRFLRIRFDSSQFGILDEASGNFFFEGQN